MRPCACVDGLINRRVTKRGGKGGDLPLVFAGKVHHAWLGGGVVTDGSLLEEAVELRGADSER